MSRTARHSRPNVTQLHTSGRRLRHVEMGRLVVSNDLADVLVIYALGSCIGVTVYDPVARIGGVAHCQLPSVAHRAMPQRVHPATFTDAGIQALFSEVRRLGGRSGALQVKLFGGASPLRVADRFAIGRRNYGAARKILWRLNQLIAAERVLGRDPRSVYLRIEDGATLMDSLGREEWICH